MKALVFYFTILLSLVLLSTEITLSWLVLLGIDIILISWLHNNITLKEFIKYSGYRTWYKIINS